MRKSYDTIVGVAWAIEQHDEQSHDDLYGTLTKGLERPSFTKRIGDEMKIEETEFEGNKKIYVISKITTIDYVKFQLETRLKPQ